jgi:hypothetical protein
MEQEFIQNQEIHKPREEQNEVIKINNSIIFNILY